ncbi:hypothetical protein MTR67_011996 [Solanum verrucosum]|uniref:Tf2-1-like SH3-like domain-containing protein n=1 Tax=Solanum verrucosum TaxID=315347 RepID=A0AAF0QDP5_SOLVR|nr:hypothetical protein MTR67_011996 [Solanum verrucosum]
MMLVLYRKAPPLLELGWLHARILIDPSTRIRGPAVSCILGFFVQLLVSSHIGLASIDMYAGILIDPSTRIRGPAVSWYQVPVTPPLVRGLTWVYLKVSSMKGVMRSEKKGNLSPRYMGPYKILRRIDKDAYELYFPNDLASVHPVFHVSLFKRCVGDPTSIVP